MVTRQRTTRRGKNFRRARTRNRSANLRSGNRSRKRTLRGSRSRTARGRMTRTRRASRARTTRRTSRRRMPARDSHGRFIRRRVRRTTARRPQRTRRVSRPRLGSSIVREASERSRAGPALVRRRWWKVDGPVDPSLPRGYAYER